MKQSKIFRRKGNFPRGEGRAQKENFSRGGCINVPHWRPPRGQGAQPLPLPFDGPAPSFAALVAERGGDVPPRAVLDELVRAGIAERDGDEVRLLSRAYLPEGDEAEAERVAILGTDVAALIRTIDHNLQAPPENRRFQRRVLYRGIPEAGIAPVRGLATERGQALLEELDQLLSAQVEGVEASGGDGGHVRQVMFGMYWAEEADVSPPATGGDAEASAREVP